VAADRQALQQGGSLPQRAWLVRLGSGIAVQTGLISLVSSPIAIARVVLGDQNRPLGLRQLAGPLPDLPLLIDISFMPGFSIAVGAGIHRIRQDVMDGCISRWRPAYLVALVKAQGEIQSLLVKPEPDPACRTQFGKPLEHRADRSDYRRIGIKAYLPFLFAPDEADRYATAQFAAGGLVADATVESCAQDMKFGFAHGAFEPQYETIVE